MRSVILIALLIVVPAQTLLAQSNARQRYSWVDDQGHKHISDEVPASAARFGYDILNEMGRVIGHVDGAKTPEEIAAEKRQMEEARLARTQEQQDQVLLMTFPTEDDLLRSQHNQEDMTAQRIESTRANMNSQLEALSGLLSQAADLQRNGETLPRYLEDRIAQQRQIIRQQRAWIADSEKELAALRSENAATLAHYRNLRGGGLERLPEMDAGPPTDGTP